MQETVDEMGLTFTAVSHSARSLAESVPHSRRTAGLTQSLEALTTEARRSAQLKAKGVSATMETREERRIHRRRIFILEWNPLKRERIRLGVVLGEPEVCK